ncbi:MAG: nucleotidyltransferase [Candidatus Aenigmarchaeota archaeon]|nr:nucleotidyltransferase [Candidatus Aenigmarchaeota archaeon]
MEITFKGREIIFNKEMNFLDKLVVEFCGILEAAGIEYVIVSGYVSILFGRTRTTEDVDMFIEKVSKEKLAGVLDVLEKKGFWVINSGSVDDAFEILSDNIAIRIAKAEKTLPNFEVKFAKKDTDFYSMKKRLAVNLPDGKIYISPIEMHIAYKLYLGSEKDMEDAYHVYKLLKNNIDIGELKRLINMLGVEKQARRELAGLYV